MTKAELLDAIRRDHATLDTLMGSLSEAQMIAPELEAGWSVKDALAHIGVWERRCAGWLDTVANGETPARPEIQDVDGANARDYETAKDIPLADILAESRQSHDAIVHAIMLLSDADLADDTRFGWPTWRMASSNSDEHYREHIEQIAAWLRGHTS